MAYVKKSWREKLLDDKDLPKVFDTRKGKMSQRWGYAPYPARGMWMR